MPSETIPGSDIYHQPVELDVDKLAWRPGVYALIFNDDGEVLVARNSMNGFYEFPGGGVELHETLEDALKREVWEETGLKIAIDQLITIGDAFFITPSGKHWHVIHLFYRCHIVGGEMRATILEDEPLERPQWVPVSALHADNLSVGLHALQHALSDQL